MIAEANQMGMLVIVDLLQRGDKISEKSGRIVVEHTRDSQVVLVLRLRSLSVTRVVLP